MSPETNAPTEKSWATGVVASLLTTRQLCEFGEIHELAEFVMGCPIWTHEFAEKELWETMRERVLAQRPELAGIKDEGITGDNWKVRLASIVKKHGPQITLAAGMSIRTESPLESFNRIAPDIPVLGVVIDEAEDTEG